MNLNYNPNDLDELNEFLESLERLEDINYERCFECVVFFPPDEMWECPTTGNKRCDKCQVDHEFSDCAPCRLAYQDV